MPDAPSILIVDDDRTVREALVRALAQAGLASIAVEGVAEARRQLNGMRAMLLDVRLTDGDGLAFLAELRQRHPDLPVIMATAYGDSERTIEAMKLGAFDYHTKPFDLDRLIATLRRAIEVPDIAVAATLPSSTGAMIGSSARMLEVWKAIGRAATSDVPVLITGESGTGKELVARAIHEHSRRRGEPFVAVNAAALSPTLLESELFGHEKGAFTGASDRRQGRFEAAGEGTLFLDEIGDLDVALQTKLLRVLQDGGFERVGGNVRHVAKARVLAATSKPVTPRAPGVTLREDLFYRLGVLRIELPPLRDRRSDIPLLVESFLRTLPRRRALTERAMERLQAHAWPGNVRELQHVLSRAAVMTSTDVIDDVQLEASTAIADDDLDLERNLRDLERRLVLKALESTTSRAEAARRLGIARTQLYAKLKDLGLTLPGK